MVKKQYGSIGKINVEELQKLVKAKNFKDITKILSKANKRIVGGDL